MERQRSPSYPSLSLPQAVEMITKLHKANRTSIISRETAAKDLGYAGLTGRSLTVIAALVQYGLVERAGKGDIKVTRRAVDILHSVDGADRAEAIRDAAFAPNLFQQLHERFPEGVPSQNALRSYLIQQDFGDVAIGPAIAAFLETNAFAENAKVSGSHGSGSANLVESLTQTQEISVQPHTTAATPPLGLIASAALTDLNKINMDIRGDQVLISGLLDLKGLRLLEKRIVGLKALLSPVDEPDLDDLELGDPQPFAGSDLERRMMKAARVIPEEE